jgi:molybdenum cofactor cytidylyltransferase
MLRLAAIVLAAGKSSRMGTNKLLLKIGNKRIIEHIVHTLQPLDTILVLGHRANEIKEIAESLAVRIIVNLDYEKGMITSFQTGLKIIDPNIEAVFMVLSDMFGFNKSLLERMSETMEETLDIQIVSPRYKGRKGHPVLIRKSLFKEFFNLEEGKTMKDVINRFEKQHRYIEADEWCTVDLDTPEDYERILEMWKQR